MRPETQIRYLIRHIRPLAKCLQDYRPSARRIHIHRADWAMLHGNQTLAVINGFVIESDEHITYQGFDLIPLDTHHRAEPS